MTEYETAACSDCGITYALSLRSEAKQHECMHSYIDGIIAKHGFIWTYAKCESIKSAAWRVIYDTNSSLSEKHDAAIIVLRAWFSRSIAETHGEYHRHVDFRTYVAMMLNDQDRFQSAELHDSLVEKFGKLGGIGKGSTHYEISKKART